MIDTFNGRGIFQARVLRRRWVWYEKIPRYTAGWARCLRYDVQGVCEKETTKTVWSSRNRSFQRYCTIFSAMDDLSQTSMKMNRILHGTKMYQRITSLRLALNNPCNAKIKKVNPSTNYPIQATISVEFPLPCWWWTSVEWSHCTKQYSTELIYLACPYKPWKPKADMMVVWGLTKDYRNCITWRVNHKSRQPN